MNVDDLTEPPPVWRPSLFRMAGLVVAGLATGALAAWLALFISLYGGAGVAILLYTLLTLVPAVALGWNGSRFRRAYSSGLAACWIAGGGVLLWSVRTKGPARRRSPRPRRGLWPPAPRPTSLAMRRMDMTSTRSSSLTCATRPRILSSPGPLIRDANDVRTSRLRRSGTASPARWAGRQPAGRHQHRDDAAVVGSQSRAVSAA